MGKRTGRWMKGEHLSHNRAGVGGIEAPERWYLPVFEGFGVVSEILL